MSDIIRLLPDHVANQIAAGEVVQRPASVVKELLENAIDASAKGISLIIKDAGKTLVQVIDDGKGMSTTDARMAFERHATSKINSAEDLFALATKGFRGEALASVAAIAHVSVKTRREEDDLGTQLDIEGSKVTGQEPVVTPAGTMISVRNLFYNVPARRKFLKSDNVELRNITNEFHRVAMAHPQIAFKFINNDSELFNLPAGTYRQRIVNIMGSRVDDKLVPIKEETELLTIHGYIGKPEFARKTKGLQYFFANDRFIKHSYLHHAVVSAFEGLLPDKANPSYFLYLDVPPDSIDINIHPTKTEVKFEDEHSIYAIVRASVKHALGQFSIDSIDFQKDTELDLPYEKARGTASAPRIEVDPDFNPFKQTDSRNGTAHKSNAYRPEKTPAWEALYTGLDESSTMIDDESAFAKAEQSLFTSTETDSTTNIFQLQRKFVISTLQSGLLVINQNRAHERILYEQLLRQLTVQNGVSQQLLFPITMDRPPEEVTILKQLQTELESVGFLFKNLENANIQIEGLPLDLKETDVEPLLDSIIAFQQEELPDGSFSHVDRLAARMASKMAIKTGDALNKQQMEQMIDELFACKEPELTAQGKKVFINLTGDHLNSKFN
ncbi:DNA mismatch repair protein MutL [Nonlabens sp. Hel1_33_55]|uniref:DNA mismatch repair endonuclease MutL n=1 Tax=Nonlabens sp. Hel1_33_55 TaxID=1336802 RepID=UPI000875B019|nr:DNA mismatch repair endonuclease MutL [Nonlabens sp. Hel1_33_55]SCY14596.1 DNA mismatch repair protein MutL [Nonlabens sp. Hel1_33_55]